jgi:hypothetical protein
MTERTAREVIASFLRAYLCVGLPEYVRNYIYDWGRGKVEKPTYDRENEANGREAEDRRPQ